MASLCYSLPLTLKFSPLNPKPFPNLSFLSQPKPKVRLPKRTASITRMSLNPTPAIDRLISVAAYTLPFFNSLQYGRYLFIQYPQLGTLFEPILPFLSLYKSVPYASFVAFFALYLGVVRNPSFSHYVRFNSMQAVTLDVLLVVPLLLTRILNPGRAGLGFKLLVWGHTGVFVFSCLCFVYGVVSSILGRTPYLPFVADAAGRQV
ncbi:translocon at the inner envelope membrane of chloroplasts 20-II [Hibiscus trionum]|uniref:Protein TIC 20 n=1 Tax=Hibiscus trionum TaxID=183268 RepID=A0A9W7HK40_HIBTR|nr:translocon at the inner envelope membrane of chloroplasts 20-II [Hibiscus trionum]